MALDEKWNEIDVEAAIDYRVNQITGEKGNYALEFEEKRAERESDKFADFVNNLCDELEEQNDKINKIARRAFAVKGNKET